MFPFFSLPRELRDEIYKLVVVSEDTLFLSIGLKAGQKPWIKASTTGIMSRTCSQLRAEYEEVVDWFIKKLQSSHRSPDEYLRTSAARTEATLAQELSVPHGMVVPYIVSHIPTDGYKLGRTLILVFEFIGVKSVGPLQTSVIQHKGGYVGWDFCTNSKPRKAALEAVAMAKKCTWTGATRYLSLWGQTVRRYVLEIDPKKASR